MRYTTHVITGVALGTTLVSTGLLPQPDFSSYGFSGFMNTGLFLAVLAIGSLLPDLDHGNSYLSNKIGISLPFKHRGVTHTIYPYFLLAVLAAAGSVGYADFVFWLSIGALFHILGDMHTAGGVKIFGFGPSISLFGPLSPKTGSIFELIFLAGYGYLLYLNTSVLLAGF